MSAGKRRRGAELEADILAATSALLKTTTYDDLTMDVIAKNAHTNKSVLYRRWHDKAEIVIAALRSTLAAEDFQLAAPDTGSLQGDLQALFDTLATRLQKLHYQNMTGLILERAGSISMADYFRKFARKNYLTAAVRECFEKAQARGERNDKVVPEYLYDLPVLLALDFVFSDDDFTSTAMHAMIETTLMPVYRQFLKN